MQGSGFGKVKEDSIGRGRTQFTLSFLGGLGSWMAVDVSGS